jgi:hypothetical protein
MLMINRSRELPWLTLRVGTLNYLMLSKEWQATAEGPMKLPSLVFGAATMSDAYGGGDKLASDLPVRSIRLALRCVVPITTGLRVLPNTL